MTRNFACFSTLSYSLPSNAILNSEKLDSKTQQPAQAKRNKGATGDGGRFLSILSRIGFPIRPNSKRKYRGDARNFPTGGLTLLTRGLKHGFQVL